MSTEPECPQRSPVVEDAKPGDYWWCACGRSKSQPFCDGSHAGSSFQPLPVTIDKESKVAWCACKRTGNQPFCDGSHARM